VSVLYVYMTDADLVQMRALSDGLKAVGDDNAHFLSVSHAAQRFSDQENAVADKSRPDHVIKKLAAKHIEAPQISWVSRFGSAALATDPILSLRNVRGVIKNAQFYRRRRREALAFIQANAVRFVIVGNDTNPLMLPVLSAARSVGAKVILARTAHIFFHRTDNEFRDSWKHHMRASMAGMNLTKPPSMAHRLFGALVRRLSPENIEHTAWGDLTSYLPTDLFSLKLARCLPGSLWHLGTPWTDLILASGDDEAEALANYGIQPERIAVIGSVVFQQIHSQLINRDQIEATFVAHWVATFRNH